MLGVDEKLGAAGVGSAGVGHREGADFVGELSVFRMLIRNITASVSHDGLTVAGGVLSTAFWPARPCLW